MRSIWEYFWNGEGLLHVFLAVWLLGILWSVSQCAQGKGFGVGGAQGVYTDQLSDEPDYYDR